MNPRNLKTHVERAVAQSDNENIINAKITSANQLKSGDLSIKTATHSEMQALRQFADDWAYRLGHGASIRNPTFGVLVHGIRTNSIDMEKCEQNKESMLQENRPFIPRADIKFVGWLTRKTPTKSASSIIVDFTQPEDANKIIDEGFIWRGEVFQCERYERQCCLKQCFNCQRYGHIGTQCKTTTACGYCAQEHSSRDCAEKTERTANRKCINCRGNHEAWNQACPIRKDELAKTKDAYATRPHYHAVMGTPSTTRPGIFAGALQGARTARSAMPQSQTVNSGGETDRGRGQKRTNTGRIPADNEGTETVDSSGSQRPQRALVPSRRAIEARESDNRRRTVGEQMDIDPGTAS
jgi:hypothetical protein